MGSSIVYVIIWTVIMYFYYLCSLLKIRAFSKGPSINNVSSEGEGGGGG